MAQHLLANFKLGRVRREREREKEDRSTNQDRGMKRRSGPKRWSVISL